MPNSTKPQYHLDLAGLPALIPNQTQGASDGSTGASSPAETPGSGSRLAQAEAPGLGGLGTLNGARRGAGSPSNEQTSRFYPRRARELQSEATSRQIWGPPTASGLSTPLRETIPESPCDDTFPDLGVPTSDGPGLGRSLSSRRSRAGTVPTQFPQLNLQQPSSSKSSARPTPSSSPFRPNPPGLAAIGRSNSSSATGGVSTLPSRFRADSLPQHANILQSASPFGPSIFSNGWNPSRDRANTHTGVHSNSFLTKHPGFQRDFADTDVKTLDYLGLVDHPRQVRPIGGGESDPFGTAMSQMPNSMPSLLSNIANLNRSNRFRSYSVNAKDKYIDDEDLLDAGNQYSGASTPSLETAASSKLAELYRQINQHNFEVQAFATHASSSRPRARTAGVLDSPSRIRRNYLPTPSRLNASSNLSDFSADETQDLQMLNDAVQAMQIQDSSLATIAGFGDQESDFSATRALWLGNIPSSTTQSSLKVIFEPFGKIESARVLTHKGCGFVNFESVEHAMRARNEMNGKEIFPGAGPIRIGYAKVPSATGDPAGTNDFLPPPSPTLLTHETIQSFGESPGRGSYGISRESMPSESFVSSPALHEIQVDIMNIVCQLGASEEDQSRIAASIQAAIQFDSYDDEIPTIAEPSHSRMYDAPKLRDIRKRIDNGAFPSYEIEETAISMLPEIAELSSDYLGNTVVQKLFENCSEQVKEAMLQNIAPHLAQIGVHKNGTWAAQKIIDVARTPAQMSMIVENLRSYAVASFLDQYGNYVIQCCLRFGRVHNNFIFETMLARLWHIAQGRFGARAMRACLESHHATKDQQRMIAAAIALHSVQLCCNQNGALLLTWLLDTCTFPQRRRVLAPLLVPHLVYLCTHKVAYLTVLKLINQKNEADARDIILRALFFSNDDNVLEEILRDQSCGATLIFKVLTTPFLEEPMRSDVVENVRKVLLRIKATHNQGYKRLMDEVGLSSRAPAAGTRDTLVNSREEPDARRPGLTAHNGRNPSFDRQNPTQFSRPNPGMIHGQHPNALSLNAYGQPDSNSSFEPYNSQGLPNMPQSLFANQMAPAGAIIDPQMHLQYQQAMLAAGRPMAPYNFNGLPMNGFTQSSPIDPFRTGNRNSGMSPASMSNGLANSGMTPPSFGVGNGMAPNTNMHGRQWQHYQQPFPMQEQPMMNGNNGRSRR